MSCITTVTVRNKITGEWGVFPCGKCPPCLKRRGSGWSFRLMQEDKHSQNSHFVTLTYDTAHVPITNKGFMSLCKSDVQKFFKRLRKLLPDATIKYYAVGEYGGKTSRPHYHAIIFNADIPSIEKAWAYKNRKTRKYSPLGAVHFGTVTGASVGYTLKYMMKPGKIPLHKNDDRLKEFSLMSKDWAAVI